jgi:hypothetical protein
LGLFQEELKYDRYSHKQHVLVLNEVSADGGTREHYEHLMAF